MSCHVAFEFPVVAIEGPMERDRGFGGYVGTLVVILGTRRRA